MKNIFKSQWLAALLALVLISTGCLSQVSAPNNSNQVDQTQSTTKGQNDGAVRYKGQEGKNALELLKSSNTVTTKTFTGIGEYVESIDGLTPDGNHFWSFYVNGQQAQVGAAQYITKSTDQIEWRLEEIKE